MGFFDRVLLWLQTSGIRLVLTAVAVFVIWKLIDYFAKKIFDGKKKGKLDPTTRTFIRKVVVVVAKAFLLIIAVSYVGFNTSSLVALVAAAGATVGLALQGGLSNFAGGVILIFMRPFAIGDFITAGGHSGTVQEIGLFYTTVITVDNQKVYLPNGTLTGSSIVNVNAEPTRRLDMDFSVSYTTDIKKLKAILTRVTGSDERVLKDPAVRVVINEYKDSAIGVQVRMWCKTADYWDLRFDMQETIKEVFDISEIEIPYQQLDVHTKKD